MDSLITKCQCQAWEQNCQHSGLTDFVANHINKRLVMSVPLTLWQLWKLNQDALKAKDKRANSEGAAQEGRKYTGFGVPLVVSPVARRQDFSDAVGPR